MSNPITIALAGNPNSGKTTVFNRLTGAHQHVGNYPGVTVDIKEGTRTFDGTTVNLIDLPGTYSLTALSEEESVARNFIIENRPDAVIDILDASTLERQLYLAIQLFELGVPVVLGFNMADVAEHAGYSFDTDLLSELFGSPIVKTVGTTGEGLDTLIDTAIKVAKGEIKTVSKPMKYGREIDGEIDSITCAIEQAEFSPIPGVPSRWLAVKLLEHDSDVLETCENAGGLPDDVKNSVDSAVARLARIYHDPPDMLIAEGRYGIISGAVSEAVTRTVEQRHDFSDQIDKVLISPVFGLPIFLALMYGVFWLTFTIGDPLMGLLENTFGWMGVAVSGLWPDGSESPLKSLLVDGIIGGVGGVVVFLPNILILFIAIAFLEDTGYMARAAFIMDQLMHKIGLHGKSFIPMLIGFGCSIPAIMGTRILENRRDRIVTILIIPLMSCGARLPIYALIIPAFFPKHMQGPMLWMIYLVGILLAVLVAKLLRSTIYKGKSTPFIMELPPYRIPTLQALSIHSWERGFLYLKKAGTVILAISIILWAAASYPKTVNYSGDFSTQLESAREAYDNEILAFNTHVGLDAGDRTLINQLEPYTAGDSPEPSVIGTGSVDDFTLLVSSLDSASIAFDSSIELNAPEEGSPDYILLENEFRKQIDEIAGTSTELFPHAEKFYFEILPAYTDTSERINFTIAQEDLENSAIGRISRTIEPILTPLGFDWKIGAAFIGALAAKEVFVAQMGIVFSIGETDEGSETLRTKLQENYSPLVGICLLLFSLISAPCIATLAITRAETRSWGIAWSQFIGLTVLAWIITLITYTIGMAFGWGV